MFNKFKCFILLTKLSELSQIYSHFYLNKKSYYSTKHLREIIEKSL